MAVLKSPSSLVTCAVKLFSGGVGWLVVELVNVLQVLCIMLVDCVLCAGRPSDRLMGVVIGVSISSGCIVICVIIILLRNRFSSWH